MLEAADEYQEVGDLLGRYATLQATNDDLRTHQQACAAQAEEVRVALQQFKQAKSDEVLSLNNRLAQLKKTLEGYEQQVSEQVRVRADALCLLLLASPLVLAACCWQQRVYRGTRPR